MIDGVHHNSARLGPNTLPSVAACLALLDQLGLDIAHLTNGGPAVEGHLAHLA
jgi:hypothetical protein